MRPILCGPSTSLDPLQDSAFIARLIGEVTGLFEDEVIARLKREYRDPGSTVAEDSRRRRVMPYVHSAAMDALYSESDAFLYESAVWNRNRIKDRMRRWVRKRLNQARNALGRDGVDVLVIGDGPGFDSLEFAQAGHIITYHELPGYQETFARKLFDACGQNIRIITDRNAIPRGAFDAVVCLDVLEHVDDPPTVVRSLTEHLRAQGLLFVHAPFYMIHPAYPTHLRANRRYSGSIALYERAGLRLIDGELGWNPLMFERSTSSAASNRLSALKRLAIRLAGLYFILGRWTSIPFVPIHWARCARGRWFDEK